MTEFVIDYGNISIKGDNTMNISNNNNTLLMKKTLAKLVLVSSLLTLPTFAYAAEKAPLDGAKTTTTETSAKISADCTLKGIALHGKVLVVDKAADFTVKMVNEAPDLTIVSSTTPQKCGEWQFVTSGNHDFTIEFVEDRPENNADFTAKVEGSLPKAVKTKK
ncbi:hypothetical protein [uncultured Bartonella sp.]|uniref:hypothetical protein n=1 Tax=uncultured Bartonella sp. TaxID=104108 RepID=UPI0026207BB1|nr:hypothetical protein [uncultured Bartonella sp.]